MGDGQGMTYAAMGADFIANVKTAMDAVIAAELRFGLPVLKALALMFVGRQFILLMSGDLDAMRFLRSSMRVLVVAYLVGQSPHYVAKVRDPVFDLTPTLQSAVLSGAGVPGVSTAGSPGEQFDKTSAATEAVAGKIQSRSTGWSVASFMNYGGAAVQNQWMQTLLGWTFALYVLGQVFLAIVLCFGPLMLLFELFERTRGWVDQWLGKIVGIVAYGLGTAILLAFSMMQLHAMLAAIDANTAVGGAEAVARFGKVVAQAGIHFLLMLALPAVCAYGSGGVVGAMAPSMMAAARGGLSALSSFTPRGASRTGGRAPGRPSNSATRA